MTKKLDLLDSADIDNCQVDLSYKNGFVFHPFLLIIVLILGLIGIAAIIYGELGYFVDPPLILLSVFGLTYQHGTDISAGNHYIRPYSRFFGLKSGKWISMVVLTDVTVLKAGSSLDIDLKKLSKEQLNKKGVYDLHLLNPNHRKRQYITTFNSLKEAIKEGTHLADLLDKEFKKYTPFISKATRARRYERHY